MASKIAEHRLGSWLHLRVRSERKHCHACSKACPMSLDVHDLVQTGSMLHDECMLSGSCVNACKFGTIGRVFGAERDAPWAADGDKAGVSSV